MTRLRWSARGCGFSAGAATVAGLLMAFAASAAANASTITSTVAHPAAPASAEQAAAFGGNLELCSFGEYASYASFPGRSGLSAFVIPNGTCYGTFLGGNTNEQVNVYDADNNQYIGSTIYNGSVGETIVTIAGPGFYAYNG
jgi:hypothetical protein